MRSRDGEVPCAISYYLEPSIVAAYWLYMGQEYLSPLAFQELKMVLSCMDRLFCPTFGMGRVFSRRNGVAPLYPIVRCLNYWFLLMQDGSAGHRRLLTSAPEECGLYGGDVTRHAGLSLSPISILSRSEGTGGAPKKGKLGAPPGAGHPKQAGVTPLRRAVPQFHPPLKCHAPEFVPSIQSATECRLRPLV
ncbi:hypothetical protein FA13DRAFT_1712416 [Coprinellus micaceus]|uniref:Uncharacterized protein n=1 Tax=Coprinellus micaceus TaxID=71717 RepID=A0A4Y7T2D9_COPMI|nr:hypothetical protein FA13DRAFT_1712416 [Coprinellus micaceus]